MLDTVHHLGFGLRLVAFITTTNRQTFTFELFKLLLMLLLHTGLAFPLILLLLRLSLVLGLGFLLLHFLLGSPSLLGVSLLKRIVNALRRVLLRKHREHLLMVTLVLVDRSDKSLR